MMHLLNLHMFFLIHMNNQHLLYILTHLIQLLLLDFLLIYQFLLHLLVFLDNLHNYLESTGQLINLGERERERAMALN